MKEFIQSILVYIVIVSVLRGLISNNKYRQYFQFFSSVMLILYMLTPILTLGNNENKWYQILEEKILQMDIQDKNAQLKVSNQRYEKVLKKQYCQVIKKQVGMLAKEKNMELTNIEIKMKKKDKIWEIGNISGKLKQKNQKQNKPLFTVETVQIGKKDEVKSSSQKEDTSKKGKELKKLLCSYYMLGEEKVQLWE